MRIFLGLGDVELAQPGSAHLLSERMQHILAWERDSRVEIPLVFGERDQLDIAQHPRSREAVEVRVHQRMATADGRDPGGS